MMLVLPLIVIGADEIVRTALEPYAQVGHIEHHPTAEDAHWALTDAATHEGYGYLVSDGEGWPVHVAYGPDAYGALTAGSTSRSHRLEHTGHTLIVGHEIDPDPGRPIRHTEGGPVAAPPNNSVWQAAVAIAADRVLDLAQPDAVLFLARYLEWKSP